MWGHDHVLRLVDFGSAAYIKDFVENPVVSFPYTAPEILDMKLTGAILRGNEADCLSMGVLLFNLAFGLNAFSQCLGWDNTTSIDLVKDLGMRAAEMRKMLHKRRAVCEEMISSTDQCSGSSEKFKDFLLPPLLGMLRPEPFLRMPLLSVAGHVRKYMRSKSSGRKKIVNKRKVT
jgi:hypothetical protein